MLVKNFFKDLKATAPRLISVIIIAAVAVLMFVGFNRLGNNCEKANNAFFENNKIADYWISGQGLNKTDCYKLQSLKSIAEVQPRIILQATKRGDDNIRVNLHGIDNYNMNIPYICEGAFPKNNHEIMLSKSFADKQDLKVGDKYELVIKGNKTPLKLTICGLVKSPEYLGLSAVSFATEGYGYVNEAVLSGITGKNIYTQICLRKNGNVSDSQIKNEINRILGNKAANILALDDNLDAYSLANTTESIQLSTVVLPIIFFLVAMLIMFSTMQRIIESSRGIIGTLKALGYKDSVISFYFISYALIVVVIGFVAGAIPANTILAKPATAVVLSLYDMPPSKTASNPSAFFIAFIMVSAACLGTAYIVTRKALKEKPAECMRPKPPKTSKKILLEQMTFLWDKLNFSAKYIIRSMMRGKARMIICIIGVVGCMALTLTSFGMNNSISNYVQETAEKLNNYDATVSLANGIGVNQYKHIDAMKKIDDVEYEMTTSVRLMTAEKKESVTLSVMENILNLKLLEPDGKGMQMPKDSAIISKKVADDLHIKIGDTITVELPSANKTYKMKISDFSKNAYGIAVSKTYWRSLGGSYSPTTAYINSNDPETVSKRLSDFDFVTEVKGRDEAISESTESLQSILMIVYIFIVFGGVLALVVLYNLGIMNFYEQTRSLATLQVLGFRDKEIKRLMFTENIIFTAMGIIAGIPIGSFLCNMMMAAMGDIEMDVVIKPMSYIISIAITMLFAISVNKMLGSKMKTIDMLGALKSVE